MTLEVLWFDRTLARSDAPDPEYPEGVDLDLCRDIGPACWTALRYPARGPGYYHIACTRCGSATGCMTKGQTDDPRSIRLPCRVSAVSGGSFKMENQAA